MYNKMP